MKHLLRWTWILRCARHGLRTDGHSVGSRRRTAPKRPPKRVTSKPSGPSVTRALIQRLYPTDGEFQLTLFAGSVPNDPFINYFPVGLRFGYWFSESIAVELSGSFLLSTTPTWEFLNAENVDVFERDEQLYRANAAVLWCRSTESSRSSGQARSSLVPRYRRQRGRRAEPGVRLRGRPYVRQHRAWWCSRAGTFHLHDRWALRLDHRQGVFQRTVAALRTRRRSRWVAASSSERRVAPFA